MTVSLMNTLQVCYEIKLLVRGRKLKAYFCIASSDARYEIELPVRGRHKALSCQITEALTQPLCRKEGYHLSSLYVTEQGATISVDGSRFIIECKNSMRREIPEETVESIVVFGNVQVTYGAQKRILEKHISMSFLSTRGRYFGRLHSTSHPHAERLKKQVYLSDNCKERLIFARKTLRAKVHNQLVLLHRYSRNSDSIHLKDVFQKIASCEKKMETAQTIEELMGHEGMAARTYFDGLSRLVDEDFQFSGRSKRPPKDPFNALLSLGYTIVFYEIYAELENQNINPYISFVHS